MGETFVLKNDEKTSYTLTLHPAVLKKLHLKGETEEITVKFGTKTIKVSLKASSNIGENNIVMSTNSIDELNISEFPKYEILNKNNELVLGPYIGLLMASTNQSLMKKAKRLNKYVEDYASFSGAVLAFSLEGIDTTTQQIYGFMFNPQLKRWEKGVYPYPAAIFRSISIPQKLHSHLLIHTGNHLFNSHYFSKWKMYQNLVDNPQLIKHLPYTKLYRKPEDLIQFLSKYSLAYIKPINGLKGRSIQEFEQRRDGYLVRFRKDNRNYVKFISKGEIASYLEMYLKANHVLIQQKLNLIFHENKIVDFRLFVLKDQAGAWKCLGWIGREGEEGSVVSNRSSGGKVIDGDTLLKKILGIKNGDFNNLKEKMFTLACHASNEMEQNGTNYGYFAIDMAIDKDQNIWIIEMNHRSPNDGLPLYVGNYSLYQKIKTFKMLYAKFLCGFPEEK